MHIIYRNEPLLFVNGPPVFIKVVVAVEESTSVFILDSENQIDQEKEEQLTEQLIGVETLLETNLAIQRKIIYLNNSFRRMVYQPLQFVMEGETVTGAIEKIEEKTVWIDLTGMHQDLIAVEMGKIEEVLWRGKPFDETK